MNARQVIAGFMFLILFGISSAATAQSGSNPPMFSDLAASHWAAHDIAEAVRKGYIYGYPDGTFRPDREVTRAEFAALLSRVAKHDAKFSGPFPFKDVPNGHWAKESIARALALGFIPAEKYGTTFDPDRPMSRLDIAEWMANGLAAGNAEFAQAMKDTATTLIPVAEYYKGGLEPEYYPHVSVAFGTGLMTGFPDGSFRPNELTKRSEIAAVLLRYEKVQSQSASDFSALNELREVGLYGTNAQSFAEETYDLENMLVFTVPVRRDIHFEGVGTLHVHRMILTKIDNDGNLYGVYAPMFLNADYMLTRRKEEERFENSPFKNLDRFYFTFAEISFALDLEFLRLEDLVRMYETALPYSERTAIIGNGMFGRVDANNAKQYGIEAAPFLKPVVYHKGTTRHWYMGYILDLRDLMKAIEELHQRLLEGYEQSNPSNVSEEESELSDEEKLEKLREALKKFQPSDFEQNRQD